MRGRDVLWAAVVVALTGCMTGPRPVADPAGYIQRETPDRIWLTPRDGERVEVEAPQMYGDSLLGYMPTATGREVVWLGVDQIETVEARRVDVLRTTLLAAGIGLGLVLAAFAVAGGGEDTRGLPDPIDSRLPPVN